VPRPRTHDDRTGRVFPDHPDHLIFFIMKKEKKKKILLPYSFIMIR
jgi:hypothetical protein